MNSQRITQFDKLTGLPFYEDFLSLAQEALDVNIGEEREFCIISTDVANFKFINQIYGYEVGNSLLQSLVKISVLDNPYCVSACRPYSDHIVGLYVKPRNNALFQKGLEEYRQHFIEQNAKRFQSVLLHLQCGIYVLENRQENIVGCVDRANIARRSMKGDYTQSCVFYNESMYAGKEHVSETISIFETALQNNDILVYYQPKVNIHSKIIEGAEALSRIRKPDGTIMNPGEYVDVLETSGRIIELDFYVMRSVFEMIAKLIREGKKPVTISVNLSRIHFYNERFVREILDLFVPYNIPAEYIEFEVTESAFFAESNIISGKLAELKRHGFKVSMDDFGTGYSSLHSLSVLPIDVVKFDRSFVRNCTSTPKGLKILSGLITLCKQIDYSVICEGVENEMEERIVNACGCDAVQGYIYDKPLPEFVFLSKYIFKRPLYSATV